jgi:hypothetical protein
LIAIFNGRRSKRNDFVILVGNGVKLCLFFANYVL